MPKQSAQYNSEFQQTNGFSLVFPHETVDELIKFDKMKVSVERTWSKDLCSWKASVLTLY